MLELLQSPRRKLGYKIQVQTIHGTVLRMREI